MYRAFAVWGRNYYIAVIPAGLLCGNIGTGVWLLNTLAQARVATRAIYASILNRSKVYFIISLAQNLLCSRVYKLSLLPVHCSPAYYSSHRMENLEKLLPAF